MLVPLGDFRRFPVLRRAHVRSGELLERVSGEIVIAAVCALAAAAWQGTHEAQTRTHLLLSVSLGNLIVAGLVGAVGGLLLVRGGSFLWELGRYRLTGRRDGVWEARPPEAVESLMFFSLVCRVFPPVELSALGSYVECIITDPKGAIVLPLRIGARGNPTGLTARCEVVAQVGTYEVRWLASTKHRKLYEVTRRRFTVSSVSPFILDDA
jgi:hypothetical protein